MEFAVQGSKEISTLSNILTLEPRYLRGHFQKTTPDQTRLRLEPCFCFIFLIQHWKHYEPMMPREPRQNAHSELLSFCVPSLWNQSWVQLHHICKLSDFSRVWLFATPGTIAHQALLSMGFSWQGYWCGLPCPPPGDLPDPGFKPVSPALQADSLPLSHRGSPLGPLALAQ